MPGGQIQVGEPQVGTKELGHGTGGLGGRFPTSSCLLYLDPSFLIKSPVVGWPFLAIHLDFQF